MFHHHSSTGETSHSRRYLVAVHLFFGTLFGLALALAFGYVVMWLWNHVLPALLGVRTITYWQSVGLLILTRILFGAHGHGRHARGGRLHGSLRRGEARHRYEEWWHEVGEASFREFATKQVPRQD